MKGLCAYFSPFHFTMQAPLYFRNMTDLVAKIRKINLELFDVHEFLPFSPFLLISSSLCLLASYWFGANFNDESLGTDKRRYFKLKFYSPFSPQAFKWYWLLIAVWRWVNTPGNNKEADWLQPLDLKEETNTNKKKDKEEGEKENKDNNRH